MSVLDDIKIIQGITDNSKDNLLNLYIRKANIPINKYINLDTPVDASTEYPDAVIQFVIECINRQGLEGLTQGMQGSLQYTFPSGLTQEVKDLLPYPMVKMMAVRHEKGI